MDIIEALGVHGGAARREALLAAGVTKHAIYAALRAGVVTQPARGCFAVPDAPLWAVRAACFRGVPTCVTLLGLWGLPLLDRDPRAHIAVPRNRALRATDSRSTSRLVLHREFEAPVRAEDAVRIALAHAARCLPRDQWLVPVDSALRQGLITVDEAMHAGRRGAIPARWTQRMADPRAESPAETRARVAMLQARLDVRSQVSIEGVGRVDFVVRKRVIVETDGREYHSDPARFTEDRRRDRAAILLGFQPLRYPAAHALRDPESIAADVRRLLRGRARTSATGLN
ncbi:DUF559 domain-containing protein [Demequina sp. SYSU T00039]|uniref:DUF559 domain-containing protein n=1 Tax=Demequina lignilytica TaxID=3051663 RepID=A0AAW7M3X3_9MICO|nr:MULTISPECIES: DUF559 domain-containing protein [unclassified Demequina]MDN4478586.1 DUF559 domain-containing protein [Demequina sp. SYSU T00039-1]MDN4488564.1 DUF559 domain-containing protein [Demequina sp. SYSU T00039]MDN4491571.1 DUF559 domain-containing protein [Demequina sp. SYSU T00068]